MKQVVSISADGTVSTLQHKGGKGLDLRRLGTVEIARASEVRWDEDEQAWYVVFCAGAGKYENWLLNMHFLTICGLDKEGTGYMRAMGSSGILMFREYEDAVAAEINVLDRLRLRGLLT